MEQKSPPYSTISINIKKKSISQAAMEKLSKALQLFDKRTLCAALVIWAVGFVTSTTGLYLREKNSIDAESLKRLGVAISDSFSFAEIMASAKVGLPEIFFKTAIFLFIPAILLVILIKVCILDEKHQGWKRASITITILATLYCMVTLSPDMTMVMFLVVYAATIVLVVIWLVRWVISGFYKKE